MSTGLPDLDGVLPCGRDAVAVWDGTLLGDDEHERHCPYCSAVLAQRRLLQPAILPFAQRPVALPPALPERIMRRVRRELRPAVLLDVPNTGGTRVRVSDTAVASAVLAVLDREPSVLAHRCRVAATPGGPGWQVSLRLAVSFEHYTRHGDQAVRERVAAALADLFDQPDLEIDLEIVDVFTDRGSAP